MKPRSLRKGTELRVQRPLRFALLLTSHLQASPLPLSLCLQTAFSSPQSTWQNVATSQTGWEFTYTGPAVPRDGLSLRPHFFCKGQRETICSSVGHGVPGETTQLNHSHLEAAQPLGNERTHGLWSNKMVFTKAVDRMWLVCWSLPLTHPKFLQGSEWFSVGQ